MRIKNLRKVSKRAASFALSAALVVGVVPAQNLMPTVKAADDNTPYVISNGRMVYASSSVENMIRLMQWMAQHRQDGKAHGTTKNEVDVRRSRKCYTDYRCKTYVGRCVRNSLQDSVF